MSWLRARLPGSGNGPADAHSTALSDRRAALISLVLCGGFFALQFAMFPTTGDQDAAMHMLWARFPVPGVAFTMLTQFARPLFATLYLLPAHWGYPAARAFTLILSLATAWLTYQTALRIHLPRAWLVVPFTLLQPTVYLLGTETMTEPTFACVLAAGLLVLVTGRRRTAAVIWSLLPLARPEGPFVIAVVAAWFTLEAFAEPDQWRQFAQAILLLGTGMLVWWTAAYLVTRDPWFIVDTIWWLHTTMPRGNPLHYVMTWPVIVGVGILPLWLAGIARCWSSPVGRFCGVVSLLLITAHSYFYATGIFESHGQLRYFVTIAPLTALLATSGAGAFGRSRLSISNVALACVLILQLVESFLVVDGWWRSHMGAATLESAERARGLIDLRGRAIVSSDLFGYVFLDRDNVAQLPFGDSVAVDSSLRSQPRGTVLLWEEAFGVSWYERSVDDVARDGYEILWERTSTVGSPRARQYDWVLEHLRAWIKLIRYRYGPSRAIRCAVLVRR